MKVLLFVFICSVASIQCYKQKRSDYDDFCGVPTEVRTLILQCVEENVSANQKRVMDKIASCFNEPSFTDVMNGICELSEEEIEALEEEDDDCLDENEEDVMVEPDFDEKQFESCLERKLKG
uniref:Uncharacterized protein n=1 Tax=Isometrus maculatus TaxID=497827 RepID=A0A0U1SPI1_ISOMC|nr:hypothetical protein [Isometrus maculatus]